MCSYSQFARGRYRNLSSLVLVSVLLSGCLGTGKPDQSPMDPNKSNASEADANYAPSDDSEPIANEYESTSWAIFVEDKEREAWSSHLDNLFELGANYAGDPTAIDDPANVDCEDFDFQEEADAFFQGAGGPSLDIFILDDDRDGMACEWLPRWYPGSDWSTTIQLP